MHGLFNRRKTHRGYAHDYIVRLECYEITGFVVGDSSPKHYNIFCIFEDPELRTLEEILSRGHHGEPYELEEVVVSNIMNQICRAVHILHGFEWGLVHRNISLRNIVEVAPKRFKLSGLLGVGWKLTNGMQPLDLDCYTDENWRSPEMQNPSFSTEITAKSGEINSNFAVGPN